MSGAVSGTVNGIGTQLAGISHQPLTVQLVMDGRVLAEQMLDPLIAVADANGTPIKTPINI